MADKSTGSTSPAPTRFGTVTLEIGTARNGSVLFAPTRTVLRGWWRRSALLSSEIVEETEQKNLPENIPGLYIVIDPKKKEARIVDPLSFPENKAIFEQVAKNRRTYAREVIKPEEERVYPDLSDTGVKSWFHWARRCVEAKVAEVRSGYLPSLEEIRALPGKTLTGAFNNSATAPRYLEDRPAYDQALRQAEAARHGQVW